MITEHDYLNINYCIRCSEKMQLSIDREDKLRPICPACGWVYYKNPVPAVACVVLNEANEVLLVKRKFEPAADEWALPSGYIEIDQTPQSAAIQELLEETGLEGEVEEFLDFFTGSSPLYRTIISFGFLVKVRGGRLQPGDDAAEARYVPLGELPHLPFASHRHYVGVVRTRKNLG